MSQQKETNHSQIILETFVVGTLAFMVAYAWDEFVNDGIEAIEEKEGVYKPGGNMLFYTGMYVIFITVFALLIVYIFLYFGFIKNPVGVTE